MGCSEITELDFLFNITYLASSQSPSLLPCLSHSLSHLPTTRGQHTPDRNKDRIEAETQSGDLQLLWRKTMDASFKKLRLELLLIYESMNYYRLLKPFFKRQVLTDFLLGWLLSYPVVMSRICNIANVPQNFGYSFGESKLRSLSNILLMVVGS